MQKDLKLKNLSNFKTKSKIFQCQGLLLAKPVETKKSHANVPLNIKARAERQQKIHKDIFSTPSACQVQPGRRGLEPAVQARGA